MARRRSAARACAQLASREASREAFDSDGSLKETLFCHKNLEVLHGVHVASPRVSKKLSRSHRSEEAACSDGAIGMVDYSKWDAMEVEDDGGDEFMPAIPPIEVPVDLNTADAVDPADVERRERMNAFDRAAEDSRAFFATARGAEIAAQGAQSAMHDELESVASSGGDWKSAHLGAAARARRAIAARLRRTPAIGAEVPLPPAAGAADYPSPMEILWCWGEGTVLLHAEIESALQSVKKPGAPSLDDAGPAAARAWKTRLGGFSRSDALAALARDCDVLARAQRAILQRFSGRSSHPTRFLRFPGTGRFEGSP